MWAISPTVLLIAALVYFNRAGINQMKQSGGGGANLFNVGKSKAKLYNLENEAKVRFADVAGCDEAKEEIMELVHFLKDPTKYEALGAKIPRGAILSGPPGTGKTVRALLYFTLRSRAIAAACQGDRWRSWRAVPVRFRLRV